MNCKVCDKQIEPDIWGWFICDKHYTYYVIHNSKDIWEEINFGKYRFEWSQTRQCYYIWEIYENTKLKYITSLNKDFNFTNMSEQRLTKLFSLI